MSPHHERAVVGCAPPAEQPALDEPAARTNGAPIEAEPEPGAAEEAEAAAVPATEAEEAVVVNAVHAHSEFWLPALQLCAAELGWRVDTEGTAPSPAMVYLPPGAGRFAFMQAPMAQRFPAKREMWQSTAAPSMKGSSPWMPIPMRLPPAPLRARPLVRAALAPECHPLSAPRKRSARSSEAAPKKDQFGATLELHCSLCCTVSQPTT